MTAATLTPSATAADLLDELRKLADELSGVLRRTRGRITRLARQDGPPEPKPPAAAEAVRTPKVERPAPCPPPRPTFAAPLPPPQPVVIEIRPDKPLPDPAAAVRPVEPPPTAPHRRRVPAVVRLVVAVLVALWAAARPATASVRRGVRTVRRAARRGLAAARPYARRVRAAGRRELDRWLS